MTNSNYFVENAGERRGPYSARQLKELGLAGNIAVDDLIWKEGLRKRVRAENVKGLRIRTITWCS
jgi:hypothetical protein